jgi:exoribonuclease-2
MELEGHIIEFVDSGALKIGYVRRRDHRKVHVIDHRGRETNVPVSRIVVVHPDESEDGFRQTGPAILARVEEQSRSVDLELLWDAVHGIDRDMSASELAEHYFGSPSPESVSAVFRALERDSLFFKRNAIEFRPRPREVVATERVRLAREMERDAFRTEVADLLRRALGGKIRNEDGESWTSVADRLERWLRHREKDEVGTIFEEIVGVAQAREAAYDLLVRMGGIEDSEDRFLIIRGFPTHFTTEASDTAHALPEFPREGRRDWIGHRSLAIDDKNTLEVDDALSVVEDAHGTTVGIHIADVAAFTSKDDVLDREAARRTATVYLPNVTVPMFPPRLSTDLASLLPGRERPAFSVRARFDAGDRLTGFTIERSLIRVTERLTYEEADGALERGDPLLGRLHTIARCLSDIRSSRGAQTHHRPEIKVHVDGGHIGIRRVDVNTPSRLIVSEMMILTNQLAADYATRHNLAVIYRTQESPDAEAPDVEGLAEALQFELLRRSFKRSHLSLTPAPHAGLGLGAYTQISSPIRRYTDLITQRQFIASMEGRPLPYDNDELLRVMAVAEATEVEIRRLEQTSTTYWVLTYLSREKAGEPLDAIVLDHRGTVELVEYLVRGRCPATEEWSPGDRVRVEMAAIHPDRGEVRFKACE